MSDTASTWASIREGVSDVERLIGQKQYNLAMVKSRQTLETMVRALAERNDIEYSDLRDTIDALTEERILTMNSAEHYHKIRMIGNRAIHENDNNPTGANTAYHLLSQELTTFATEFAPKKRKSIGTRTTSDKSPVQNTAHSTSTRTNKKIELAFKVMIPVLVIILIVAVVNIVVKKNKAAEETTVPEVEITMETVQAPRPTEPETKPETIVEEQLKYTIIGDRVNVRTEPNTECEILGQLNADDEVEYISDYDDEWAEILYNGQTAYVSKQFLNTNLTVSGVQVE